MLRWIFLLVLLLLVLIVGGMGVAFATSPGLRKLLSDKYFPDPRLAIRLSEVRQGELVRTVNAPGSIEPKTKVQISAQVSARITDLPFREGQSVRKGDVLVRLDARDLSALVESAQANMMAEEARLRGNEAQLTQSKSELARARQLFDSKDVARSALDESESVALRAQSAVDATKQGIAAANAAIVRAKKDLENSVIIAPFDGTIVRLNAEVGELVVIGTLNNAGSVIMEVADLGVMLMKARVDESNIAPVRAGQAAKVYINAYSNRKFVGAVERVGLKRLVSSDGTGYFEVEVLVDKPTDILLGSGLTCNADIAVERFADVLMVPSQAVLDRRLDAMPESVRSSPLIDRTKAFVRVVFMMEGGKAVPKAVVTGASDLTDTIVLSGLSVGDKVISGPFKVLVDMSEGKLVELEKEKVKLGADGPAKPNADADGELDESEPK